MFYLTHDGQLDDDGYGFDTAPAYRVDERGARVELPPDVANHLTQQFADRIQARDGYVRGTTQAQVRSMGALSGEKVAEIDRQFPIGDVIASLTGALGIAPCAPCKQRQEALNRFGNRVANLWR